MLDEYFRQSNTKRYPVTPVVKESLKQYSNLDFAATIIIANQLALIENSQESIEREREIYAKWCEAMKGIPKRYVTLRINDDLHGAVGSFDEALFGVIEDDWEALKPCYFRRMNNLIGYLLSRGLFCLSLVLEPEGGMQ